MLWYTYNNIIVTVTNAIILEFLSARFLHSGALQITILFFQRELERENNKS